MKTTAKKAGARKATPKARATVVQVRLARQELAQLDGEVERRGDGCTRAGVLIDFVRSLPAVKVRAGSAASKPSKDAYGIYQDIAIAGIVQRFRWIAPCSFVMGSPPNEFGRWDDEVQHEVTITKGYWIADTAVTQAFYEAVMGSNPSRFKGAALPVENVSHDDVKQSFIAKLNGMAPGLDARLPTEAEWEYACRGGTAGATYRGELGDTYKAPVLDDIAWYWGNSPNGTQPVKTKAPNAFGLYDMLGNVWEWCEDWHGEYPGGSVTDPKGPSTGSSRRLRGGSWSSLAWGVRAASRDAGVPSCRGGGVGFRLARGQ